jgi:predicted  nucleic acid-binding Zn ribbon protein
VVTLVDNHIDRLEEDGRAIRTIDTYRYCAELLGKIIASVLGSELRQPKTRVTCPRHDSNMRHRL